MADRMQMAAKGAVLDTPTSSPASDIVRQGPNKRSKAETRFKMYGLIAIIISLGFLAVMVTSIVIRGTGAFTQSFITLEMEIPDDVDPENLNDTNWRGVMNRSLRAQFPDVKGRSDRRSLTRMLSSNGEFTVRDAVAANPDLIGTTAQISVRTSSDIDMLIKGNVDLDLPENQRRVTDKQVAWLNQLKDAGAVDTRFNERFFTSGDSREPEQAGIWGAVVGSFLSLLVCFALSFPLGTMAAVYLEEFAPKGRISQIIEVNINNLAAVPSIVFGLLGLATPNFLLALVMMYFAQTIFGVSIGGLMDAEYIDQPMSWDKFKSILEHLIVPTIVIGTAGTAAMIRRIRANLLDELQKQYVTTARAKGVPPFKALVKYPLRMSLNFFVADIGSLLPAIISGAEIVAIVLSLQTTGPLLIAALQSQDMYLAGSFLMFLATLTVIGVLLSDILLGFLDPRIRLSGGASK